MIAYPRVSSNFTKLKFFSFHIRIIDSHIGALYRLKTLVRSRSISISAKLVVFRKSIKADSNFRAIQVFFLKVFSVDQNYREHNCRVFEYHVNPPFLFFFERSKAAWTFWRRMIVRHIAVNNKLRVVLIFVSIVRDRSDHAVCCQCCTSKLCHQCRYQSLPHTYLFIIIN